MKPTKKTAFGTHRKINAAVQGRTQTNYRYLGELKFQRIARNEWDATNDIVYLYSNISRG